MGKKALAQLIGILVGLLAWLAVGTVGLLFAVAANAPSYRTIGAWLGMFAGAFVWNIVSKKLEKQWGITKN